MVAPVVPFSREIDPFGVTELVPHEVEVAFAGEGYCYEPDHFVQSHASEDAGWVWLVDGHLVVDIFVEEPHGEGLVADEGLVM